MRRLLTTTLAALSLAACSTETTGPSDSELFLDERAFGTEITLAGGYDASLFRERLFNALPDELRLSDAQKQRIRDLVETFEASTKADREALNAILREARDAYRAGRGRDEIRQILRNGAPVRERLAAAERKLLTDIRAVLTPEQRAWLDAHRPRECRPQDFPPLTEAQRAQIHALEAAFRENNEADLEAMRTILQEARAAVEAGKSREEIAAVLSRAGPVARRLAEARFRLRQDILAVLTPEQKASRCLPLG